MAGKLHMDDLALICNPEGIKANFIPDKIQHYAIMNSKLNVLKGEELGCHPCVCTSSLKMKTADVIEKFLPETGHDFKTVHLVGE